MIAEHSCGYEGQATVHVCSPEFSGKEKYDKIISSAKSLTSTRLEEDKNLSQTLKTGLAGVVYFTFFPKKRPKPLNTF